MTTPVLLAAPSQPGPITAPVRTDWPGLTMTWTGWDGSLWELTEPSSGVQLKAGVRGLTMPAQHRHTRESPAVAGSRWAGWRALEREVFWPLGVYTDAGSQAWLDYDRAFWRTMHPAKTGVWAVTQPDGTSRSLTCRFDNDAGHALRIDPSMVGWEFYGVYLVAESPFWQGQPITRLFVSETPADFFGGGSAPPFTISSGSTLANATIGNPGDVDAWPVHTVRGPSTSAEVGVGGRVVEVPITLAEGEWVRVDTDPTAQTAVDNTGADRTAELGEVDFAPVEPGASVALSLSMVGGGSVEVSLTPRYLRAW